MYGHTSGGNIGIGRMGKGWGGFLMHTNSPDTGGAELEHRQLTHDDSTGHPGEGACPGVWFLFSQLLTEEEERRRSKSHEQKNHDGVL